MKILLTNLILILDIFKSNLYFEHFSTNDLKVQLNYIISYYIGPIFKR